MITSQSKEWTEAEERGWSRFQNADFRGALDAWHDAVCVVEERDFDARRAATSLQHVALAYAMLGEADDAIMYLERAIVAHYEAIPPTTRDDHRFRAECHYRLGTLYHQVDDALGAVDCYSRAIPLAVRCEDTALLIESLMGCALTIEREGDVVGALNLLNRARLEARALPTDNELRRRAEQSVQNLLLAASEL